MNVETMRKVDYFAGIPLCFLATLLVRFVDLLRSRQRQHPKRVLFIELSEMGSTILADPAMRKMQEVGNAELYFLIFASNAASLRLLNTIPETRVFTIRSGGFLGLATDSLRFIAWARRCKIDTVIDLELFSRYSALLTGVSGAANRIGFHAFHNEGLYRGNMLTRRVTYNPHQHIAKNFVALVNAALAGQAEHPFSKTLVKDAEVRLARAEINEHSIMTMRERIRAEYPSYDPAHHRIALINPNASDLLPQRRWMPDRFAAVICGLLGSFEDLLVLITGAPAERGEADTLKQLVGHPRCVNFAGRQSLKELPALYEISDVMLTNDSGPGHFSAVTGLRTFVIFGPETPSLYGSLGNSTPIYAGLSCSPCVSASNHRKTPCSDNVCLQVITPHMVLALMRKALGEGSPSELPEI